MTLEANADDPKELAELISRIVDQTVPRVLAHLAVPQVAKLAPPAPPAPASEPPARRYSERAALSLKEAGQMIGVSAKTLIRQHKLGRLSCLRVGGQWRVTVAEVHAFLRRNERKG